MDFVVKPTRPTRGAVVYRERSLAFDFELEDESIQKPTAESSIGIALGALTFQADRHDGRVMYAWGYHPRQVWKEATQEPSAHDGASLIVRIPQLPPPGVSVRLARDNELETYFDSVSGWVRIVRKGAAVGTASFVEFASNSVAELVGTELRALWLHPTFLA
jgi:hypothetical protein